MRNITCISRHALTSAIAVACLASAADAATNILNLANARSTAGTVSIGSVGGRSGVATLNASSPSSSANIWGTATGGNSSQSGFGMSGSGNAGVGGWAGSNGALLSDITGVSFDWFNSNGGLGGGFRMAMYVYSPTAQGDISGFLQFDLTYLLSDQDAGEWNSTGNMLVGATGSAWYSADYGSSQFTGYKTWAEIQTALAGWSVYEIGIINDAGITVSVDNFAVSSVPAPGALALLGVAGFMGSRRRR